MTDIDIARRPPAPGIVAGVSRVMDGAARRLAAFPPSLTQLVLRIAVAIPFWRSGMTKWDGFLHLSDSAVYLFQEEFRLHVFGGAYAFPAPALFALLSATGEVVLPVLLVLGIGTRFAALGLLGMIAVIQLTEPDGWANFHLPWAAMALAILTYGPGRFALDHLVRIVWRRSAAPASRPEADQAH